MAGRSAAVAGKAKKVAADGLSITPVNNVAIAGAVSGRVSKLSGSLLVTPTRTGSGKVDLTLWRIENGKLVVTPAGHAVSQSGTGYDLQAVDSGRFALGTRTAQGNLRLENWELVGGGGGSGQDDFQTIGMQLAGAGSGGAVSEIALCKNATGQVTTAVRTGGSSMRGTCPRRTSRSAQPVGVVPLRQLCHLSYPLGPAVRLARAAPARAGGRVVAVGQVLAVSDSGVDLRRPGPCQAWVDVPDVPTNSARRSSGR